MVSKHRSGKILYSFSGKENSRDTSKGRRASPKEQILQEINPYLPDSSASVSSDKSLKQIEFKNSLGNNLLHLLISEQNNSKLKTGVQSISYFKIFEGKKIAAIKFKRLAPFGPSLGDTNRITTSWIEQTGNSLHWPTYLGKLRMQLLFKEGEKINALLMAENEKLIRDLPYIEDVAFIINCQDNSSDEVEIIVVSKDRFEYGLSMSLSTTSSDLEITNENMFGMGHQLILGASQRISSFPAFGAYASYHVNNILGQFINSTVDYSDTYRKKGWNISIEKKFLTSADVRAGGFSIEKISRFNYISKDHPIRSDSSLAYFDTDVWFAHAFNRTLNPSNKTILSYRYIHQKFDWQASDSLRYHPFFRNHDFFITGLSFSHRNLFKNNLIYGYGVTEDIPYGYLYEFKAGLDKSQFGTWPYLGLSVSNSFLDTGGSYYSWGIGLDGFIYNKSINQGTFTIKANFFSKKFSAFNGPCRQFLSIELMTGINRYKEEYLTIDGRYGIRDFYSATLHGNNRLKFNLETVRYLNWHFYGFRFTNYYFADFAFLSDNFRSLFSTHFYSGLGSGIRIHNESLIFKIIDIRLTWFPLSPPNGMPPFSMNIQGSQKGTFNDYLGKKAETFRYQ
jgi:hypothetical protein